MKNYFQALLFFPILLLNSPSQSSASDFLPTDVTILTQEDFIGRPFYSVADALNELTSINIEQKGYRGTRAVAKTRGLPGRYTRVYIDGQPLSHEYDFETDLSQIPLNMIERIEISRGGGSVSLGAEGAAGIINIVTLRPSEKGLLTRLGTGVGRDGVKHSYGNFRGRSNLGDLTYAGGREDSGGFMTNEDYSATNHFVNLTRSFNGKGYWGAEYYFQESDVGLGRGTLVPFSEWNGKEEHISADSMSSRTQEFQRAKFYLASPQIKKGFFYLTLTQSWRDVNEFEQIGGPALLDQTNRSFDADLAWKTGATEIGIQNRQLTREIFPLPQETATQNAVYAYHKWSGDKWTAVPGLRYTHHSKAGGGFDPRLALLYSPSSSWAFSSTAQTARREPSFDELFISSGVTANSHLNAEKSVSADLGAAWTNGSLLKIQLTGFIVRVRDLVQPNGANQWTNDGTENSNGVEGDLKLHAGSDTKYRHISLTGQWTIQTSRLDTSASSGEVPSALSPRHVGRIRLDYHLPRHITISNELRHQSEQFELPDRQGVRIPPFTVWNARIGFKIWAADLYIEGYNLTRRRYADSLSRFTPPGGSTLTLLDPQPESTFWTGITIRFEN